MIALCLVSDQTSKFSRFTHRNLAFLPVWSRSSYIAHVILVCVASWDAFGKNLKLMLNVAEQSPPKWSSSCSAMLKILSCESRNSGINCLSWKPLFSLKFIKIVMDCTHHWFSVCSRFWTAFVESGKTWCTCLQPAIWPWKCWLHRQGSHLTCKWCQFAFMNNQKVIVWQFRMPQVLVTFGLRTSHFSNWNYR